MEYSGFKRVSCGLGFVTSPKNLLKGGLRFVTSPKNWLKGGLRFVTSPPCCQLYLLSSVALSQTGSVIMESLCCRKLEQPRNLSHSEFLHVQIGSQQWISTNITSVRISPSNVSGKRILPGIVFPDPSKPPSFQLNKNKIRSCEGNSWVFVISPHTYDFAPCNVPILNQNE